MLTRVNLAFMANAAVGISACEIYIGYHLNQNAVKGGDGNQTPFFLQNVADVESYSHFQLALQDINDDADLLANCTVAEYQSGVTSRPLAWIGPEELSVNEFTKMYYSFNTMIQGYIVPVVSPVSSTLDLVEKHAGTTAYPDFIRTVHTHVDHYRAFTALCYYMEWRNVMVVTSEAAMSMKNNVIRAFLAGDAVPFDSHKMLPSAYNMHFGSAVATSTDDLAEDVFSIMESYGMTEWRIFMVYFHDQSWWPFFREGIIAKSFPAYGKPETNVWMTIRTDPSQVIDLPNVIYADATAPTEVESLARVAHRMRWQSVSRQWNATTDGWHDATTNPLFYTGDGTTWDVGNGDAGDGVPDEMAMNVYDSVLLVAHALDALQKSGADIFDGTAATQSILEQDFAGITGRMFLSEFIQDRRQAVSMYLYKSNFSTPALLADAPLQVPTLDASSTFCVEGKSYCLQISEALSNRTLTWADNTTNIPQDGGQFAGGTMRSKLNSVGFRNAVGGEWIELEIEVKDNFKLWVCPKQCYYERVVDLPDPCMETIVTDCAAAASTWTVNDSIPTACACSTDTAVDCVSVSDTDNRTYMNTANFSVSRHTNTDEPVLDGTVADLFQRPCAVPYPSGGTSFPKYLRSSKCISCLETHSFLRPNFFTEEITVDMIYLGPDDGFADVEFDLMMLWKGKFCKKTSLCTSMGRTGLLDIRLGRPNDREAEDNDKNMFVEVLLPKVNFSNRFYIDAKIRNEPLKPENDDLTVHPETCSPGTYKVEYPELPVYQRHQCSDCIAGTFSNESDAMSCTACDPGDFNPDAQQNGCMTCSPGFHTPAAAATSCMACAAGRVSAEASASKCDICPFGTFSSELNSTSCTSCSAGEERQCQWIDDSVFKSIQSDQTDDCVFRTTSHSGAESVDSCVCPVGTYRSTTDPTLCVRCQDQGMRCLQENMTAPQQADGFWIEPSPTNPDDYLVWICMETHHCEAGPVGLCPENREQGVQTCARCKENFYPSQGMCHKCDDVDLVPAILLVLFFGGPVLFFFHVGNNAALNKMHRSSVSFMLRITLLVSTLLCFNVFAGVDIEFVYPLSEFWEFFKIFVFDFTLFKLPCVVSSSSPVAWYLFKILILPSVVLMLIGQAVFFSSFPNILKNALKICHLKVGSLPFRRAAIFNTVGSLFTVFMITISLLAFEPLQCVQHPNGRSTMISDHSVTCHEDQDHIHLVIIGVCALIAFPVAVLSVMAYFTLNFHAHLARRDSSFRQATGFIFKRFTPECYYFGFLFALRNFLLPLVSVISGRSFAAQIILLSVCQILWLVAVVHYKPWRVDHINRVDGILATGLLLVVICLGLLPYQDRFRVATVDESAETVGWFVVIISVAVFVFTMMSVIWLALKSVMNKKKKYDFFLSHHKRDTAVLAFQLKIMIRDERPSCSVFLDVDDLERLDTLAFTVRSDVRHLVILMSTDIFTRMWCAMEIAVAFRNDLNIIPVACFASQDPGEQAGSVLQTLEKVLPGTVPVEVDDLWTAEQLQDLRKSNVELDDIRVAYNHLRGFLYAREAADVVEFNPIHDTVTLRRGENTKRAYFATMPLLHCSYRQVDALQVILKIADQNDHAQANTAKSFGRSNSSNLSGQSSGAPNTAKSFSKANSFKLSRKFLPKSTSTLYLDDNRASFSLKDEKRALETIIVCDFENASILAAARVLGLLLSKQGNFSKAISPDLDNLSDLKTTCSNKTFVIFLSPSLHLNPAAVAFIHFCCENDPVTPCLRDSSDGNSQTDRDDHPQDAATGTKDAEVRDNINLPGAANAEPDDIYARTKANESQVFSPGLVTVFFGEYPAAMSTWSQDAIDGRLWNDDFWKVLQMVDPKLKNDVSSRTKIVEDFQAIHSHLAMQFSPDKSSKILGVEFDKIFHRISM